jgi:hypothetical protein
MENLIKSTVRKLKPLSAGLWISDWHDDYDAARLLLPDFIRSHPVKGEYVGIAPNRDTLIVTGSKDVPGLAQMATLADQALDRPYAISGLPLWLDDAQWVEFPLPQDGPLWQPFQKLAKRSAAMVCQLQQQVLQQHLKAEGQNVHVASVLVLTGPDGAVSTLSTWGEGITTLLPRTDEIALMTKQYQCALGRERITPVPWQAIEQVVGGRMKPMGLSPERYRVDTFPTPEECRAIREIVEPTTTC